MGRSIIVTILGFLLIFGIMGAFVLGADGVANDDGGRLSTAELVIGALFLGLAALKGFYEEQWRLWRLPLAVVFAAVGCVLTVVAITDPWLIRFMFDILIAFT